MDTDIRYRHQIAAIFAKVQKQTVVLEYLKPALELLTQHKMNACLVEQGEIQKSEKHSVAGNEMFSLLPHTIDHAFVIR